MAYLFNNSVHDQVSQNWFFAKAMYESTWLHAYHSRIIGQGDCNANSYYSLLYQG